MQEWIVYVDGVQVHRYRHSEQLSFDQWPDAVQVEVPAPPQPEPSQQPPRLVSKFAFRSRFTQAEKAAIELASLDNPAADMQQRVLAASLRASQNDMAVATFVDLNHPATRQGVQALEQYGLLAPGRAAEILDAEVTESERWNG
jgi:hypothetical protein